MRLLTLLYFALLGTLSAAEQPTPPAYPLWDGQESVAQYAARVNLPPTQTLDLGNGIKLETVLIPAGKFVMGTPEPIPVDEDKFRKQIVLGKVLLALGGGVLLVLLSFTVVRAIRKRRRLQFSLARFLGMAFAASVAVLSGMHWRHSVQTLEKAQAEYQAALARYDRAGQDSGEKHAHPVTLTQPFYMGKFVVTQEQYQEVMGEHSSLFKGRDHPVEMVSDDNAQAFCKKLTEQTKQTVRLPTEAEWEYSCRAGTTTTYHSGDTEADLARVGWSSANSKYTTHPVGQKEPNVFGLYDMHGNVWQWCQDWYDDDYYGKSEAEDPKGPEQGDSRVLRGGAWNNYPRCCRSAFRYSYIGVYHRHFRNIGFRVVVVPVSRTP